MKTLNYLTGMILLILSGIFSFLSPESTSTTFALSSIAFILSAIYFQNEEKK